MKDEVNIAITDELIVRYLAGEANPNEALALHDWLVLPENKLHFENFQSAWHNSYSNKKLHSPDARRAWQNILGKLDAAPAEGKTDNTKTISYNFYFRIAAAIIIILVVGVFAYIQLHYESLTPQISIVTKNTLHKLVLPDSSHATISHHSKLEYAKNFNNASREIYLSGEAFFDVTHNADKPFIVHTSMADIKVLGTAFNVAIKNNKTEVSVARGKVLVYTQHDSVYLEPGQSATIIPGAVTFDAVALADVNTWGYATHKFEFKNTPLNDIFTCIEKSYPYTIKAENDAIKNCKLTAAFDNKSAEYIITLLAETLDLTLTKKGHVFILEGKGCP